MRGYWVVEVSTGETQKVAEVGCVEAEAGREWWSCGSSRG